MNNARANLIPTARHLLLAQLERLIAEHLCLGDIDSFHIWLRGPTVHGSWIEFLRDYSTPSGLGISELNRWTMIHQTQMAVICGSEKLMIYNPDKTDWTATDHHVRFMATVIKNNLLTSAYPWTRENWMANSSPLTKAVYEALLYLKASHVLSGQSTPNNPQQGAVV